MGYAIGTVGGTPLVPAQMLLALDGEVAVGPASRREIQAAIAALRDDGRLTERVALRLHWDAQSCDASLPSRSPWYRGRLRSDVAETYRRRRRAWAVGQRLSR